MITKTISNINNLPTVGYIIKNLQFKRMELIEQTNNSVTARGTDSQWSSISLPSDAVVTAT